MPAPLFLTLLLALPAAVKDPAGPPPGRSITVWLMPNEPADEEAMNHGIETIPAQVAVFNRELEGEWVRVVNTTNDAMLQSLLAWNPEYATPHWPMIKGQLPTLRRFGAFAKANRVRIDVLIVSWGTAFNALNQALGSRGMGGPPPPDIAQVGSTWVAHFADEGMVVAPQRREHAGRLTWRGLPGKPAVTLLYFNDVRMIFYWKHRPGETAAGSPLVIDVSSWEALIKSLMARPTGGGWRPRRPPMAFPTGLTLDLLHDYAPLVWAGGGDFLRADKARVDLSSDNALRVPLLLGRNAVRGDAKGPYRILAFPEMGHEEALRAFYEGEYTAIIEPIPTLGRWKTEFERRHPDANFWDYAAVTPLPEVTFRGGSDLMVTSHAADRDLAFALARFIAADPECSRRLAELGNLPEQWEGPDRFGVGQMLQSLKAEGPHRIAFEQAIRRAIAEGREYSDLPSWPTEVETRDVLESMQLLWRRIGESDGSPASEDRIRGAAENTEWAINRQINWTIMILDTVFVRIPLLSALIIIPSISFALAMARASRLKTKQLLALRLYRSKIHSLLHAYGCRVKEFSGLPPQSLPRRLRTYGHWIAKPFNSRMKNNVRELCAELEGAKARINLGMLVGDAYKAARTEFFASEAHLAPHLSLARDPALWDCEVKRSPHLLTVVLQEWFLNCLSNNDGRIPMDPTITVTLHRASWWRRRQRARLIVNSPTAIRAEEIARLQSPGLLVHLRSAVGAWLRTAWARFRRSPPPPTRRRGEGEGEGLPLIRDLLRYGYRVRPHCRSEPLLGGRTVLSIPIPIVSRSR
jgi:hypothetical protein